MNYHNQSMKWEDRYADELLEMYGFLLIDLNTINKLTKENIDNIISEWNSKYATEILLLTNFYMRKLDNFANQKIIENDSPQPISNKIDDLTASNVSLINLNTEYIRQEYTKLGILEDRDSFSQEAANTFVQTIANQIEDKLTLYATMAISTGLHEFIIDNATLDGWTQGLWRTQRDSKVRASHAAMDGLWINLDNPQPKPADHQPGCDYNCRCWYCNFRKPGPIGWIYKNN